MSNTDLPSLPATSAEAAEVRAPAFPLATGSEISRLVVEAYLEQRRVLNDKLVDLMGNSTQWNGYPVAHRDITAELVRLDGLLGKIATSPNAGDVPRAEKKG